MAGFGKNTIYKEVHSGVGNAEVIMILLQVPKCLPIQEINTGIEFEAISIRYGYA